MKPQQATKLAIFPSLVEVQARVRAQEFTRQHARVTGRPAPSDVLDQIKTARLRLILVDGRKVNRAIWPPEINSLLTHPAWPGGSYLHELVWAYAEDNTINPSWIVLPNPSNPQEWQLRSHMRQSRDEPDNQETTKPEQPTPAQEGLEEVPEKVRADWRRTLAQFVEELPTYPRDQPFQVNTTMLSMLPCYWPLVRMTLNAKGAINRFRSAAKRLFHNAQLQGHTGDGALAIVQCQANEIELMAIRPLAQLLASLFCTNTDLPFTASATKWAQLTDPAFWTIAILSELCRFNREQSEEASGEDDMKYQNRGIVNIQLKGKC